MSFAEFQIRLFAYKRVQDREWEKVRLLAWHAMTGSHQNPKKMPKSLNEFMRLDLDYKQKSTLSQVSIDAFLSATKDYLAEKNK